MIVQKSHDNSRQVCSLALRVSLAVPWLTGSPPVAHWVFEWLVLWVLKLARRAVLHSGLFSSESNFTAPGSKFGHEEAKTISNFGSFFGHSSEF